MVVVDVIVVRAVIKKTAVVCKIMTFMLSYTECYRKGVT